MKCIEIQNGIFIINFILPASSPHIHKGKQNKHDERRAISGDQSCEARAERQLSRLRSDAISGESSARRPQD